MTEVTVRAVRGDAASGDLRTRLVKLFDRAFAESTGPLFEAMRPVLHVVAEAGPEVLSHAMWVERALQVAADEPVRTAYVEFVATDPGHWGRGLASTVMRRLVEEMGDAYPLAALCTGSLGFYRRLGWRSWEGALAVRLPSGRRLPTPEEHIMFLDLSGAFASRRREPLSAEWREGELW